VRTKNRPVRERIQLPRILLFSTSTAIQGNNFIFADHCFTNRTNLSVGPCI
jgi:hypothetical protein